MHYMPNKYEIIIVGYRWYWQTLERTVASIVSANKKKWRINVGLNSPEPKMVSMIQKYKKFLNHIETSNNNLNKVGMQRRLVHLSSAKYIVSFDHDSYIIDKDWQSFLMERVESYENKQLRYFGYFEKKCEELSRQRTNNTVGILGGLFNDRLDGDMRRILRRCPWYDPVNKVNHEIRVPEHTQAMVRYCAGAFYVFLRGPYIKFDYPGFDYKMMHEDVILSYFFQHHGYRLGDLVSGFIDSGLNSQAKQTALGDRVVLTEGPRTFDIKSVETCEHSLNQKTSCRISDKTCYPKKLKKKVPKAKLKVIKRFDAIHLKWNGPLLLLSDGTFQGGLENPNGRWKMQDKTLILSWYKWPKSTMTRIEGGYSSTNSLEPFVLIELDTGTCTLNDCR
jgi:hypothetical protein